MSLYYNFVSRSADGYWARRSWLHSWWRINARDARWVPPSYPILADALLNERAPHLRRFGATPLSFEAMARQSKGTELSVMALPAAVGDQIVGTLLPLTTTGVGGGESYLAMLTCANDEEIAERILGVAWERAAEAGGARLLGPAELAPAFSHGLLLDHFDVTPPLHTPYNAPYLPEILEGQMETACASRLWMLEPASARLSPKPENADFVLEALEPARLAGDLLPLLQQTVGEGREGIVAPPDRLEVEFMLRLWEAAAPLQAWQAVADGGCVGFVLAQADTGRALRWLRGGYPYWGRAGLRLRPPRVAETGRVLLGAVAAEWRGRRVGAALAGAVVEAARAQGWRSLAIGPVAQGSPAEALLARLGATPRQRYALLVAE